MPNDYIPNILTPELGKIIIHLAETHQNTSWVTFPYCYCLYMQKCKLSH